MTSVAIIDYGSGNLHSAVKAFERAARDAGGGWRILVTSDPDQVRQAGRIVLPGVGAFRDCRDGLKAVPGMWETLKEQAIGQGRPFLGICVGMQLMATRGLELAAAEGFGWIAGEVRRIKPGDGAAKVPHIGWNTLARLRPHALLAGVPEDLHAYFVHSYHLVAEDRAQVIAETDHAGPIAAMVGRDNIAGTQFHPEKSQSLGLALIANFLAWRP